MLSISNEEFNIMTQYIYKICGIHFELSKKYLVEMRLSKIADEFGCRSYQELYQMARTDGSKRIDRKIIDAISINETLFFRDKGPFELLRQKILPELNARNNSCAVGRPLRIWSSACATGQEVYSIAMTVKETLMDLRKYSLNLLGTDISDAALTQAKMGRYNKFEIERGLPKDKLARYFVTSGGYWQIKDEIRSLANFQNRNLMQPFTGLGKFDIIFCRNVAIYFTLEDRQRLFNKIADLLEKDGYLIIGSTESLTGVCNRFIPERFNNYVYYKLRQVP